MVRTICVGAVAGAVATIFVLLVQGQPFRLTPVGMTYADLAATLLAASAVLLTIIGIFIAALAVWGFTAFRAMTKSSAKAHVTSQLKSGDLRNHVESVVTEFLTREFAGGNLRRQLEERLDAILISAPAERAASDTTNSDAPLEDL
jgi:hypothetical protein